MALFHGNIGICSCGFTPFRVLFIVRLPHTRAYGGDLPFLSFLGTKEKDVDVVLSFPVLFFPFLSPLYDLFEVLSASYIVPLFYFLPLE